MTPRFTGRAGRWLPFVLALGACDPGPRTRDASASAGAPTAQVSVRVDVPEGGAPSISVLAFRALSNDLVGPDVLDVVDPLVGSAPELGCERRDVAGPARSLAASGGRLDLEAMPDVTIEVGPTLAIRPAARVYPALAAVVGGVVAEAGPVDLTELPPGLVAAIGEIGAREPLTLPAAPRVRVPSTGPRAATLDAKSPLVLAVSGPPRTFVEIRPFGATWLLACPVGPGGEVTVPAADLERLDPAGGPLPVSLEAVWRETRTAGGPAAPVRLSLEVRSSLVVELEL